MSEFHNQPTVQYCIEATVPDTGDVVDRFTIEQVECKKKFGCVDNGNYNAVQKHLNDLAKRNGLNYSIVSWGDVIDCSAWIKGQPFD